MAGAACSTCSILLPLIVLSFQPIALILRQTRAAVIEVHDAKITCAPPAPRACPEHVVALRHILRPVLTPVVTQLGLIMITIVNGAIFVELVFGLPGLGRLTVQALINSDYPVILAITLIGSFLVMASNLLVDLLYPLLDPRAADAKEATDRCPSLDIEQARQACGATPGGGCGATAGGGGAGHRRRAGAWSRSSGPGSRPMISCSQNLDARNLPPSLAHCFGTDDLGRDVMSAG